ncbi:MAG: methyltransferase domain-containing protein [Burkholderiaceae bacterium]|nr:methyltransferase domain-containing protein [Burkholderiaceae bacterium]
MAPVSVAAVRQCFLRPERCADSQFLRREISARMFERLALIKTDPQRMLDAGCGEGDDLLGLQQAFPSAQLIGLDLSLPMIDHARRAGDSSRSGMKQLMSRLLARRSLPVHGAALACADFGALPVGRSSIDLVWSNLALHWHPQPHRVIDEWSQAMRTGGLLMFSCFGPDTFAELREAFAAADGEPSRQRVLPFVDLHDYGDMLLQAGFETPVMDMEKMNITYSSVEKLLADVRAFGGNPSLQRPQGLQGRRQWERFVKHLGARRTAEGKITLTIEVVYGHAFRSAPRSNSRGEAIVRFERRRS